MANQRSANGDGVDLHRSRTVEEVLDRAGVSWQHNPHRPVDSIQESPDTQVRKNATIPALVRQYGAAIDGGAALPSILVTEHGEVADGRNRLAAHKAVGRETIAAYELGPIKPEVLDWIILILNQTNGKRMDTAELKAYVQRNPGLDPKIAAPRLGCSPASITNWLLESKFEDRAERMGLSEKAASLTSSTKQNIAKATNDSLFGDATELAVDSNISTADMGKLITRANRATSEDAALEVIREERKDRDQEILTARGGFRPYPRVRVGRKIAALREALPGDVRRWVDEAPEDRPQTRAEALALRDMLNVFLSFDD